MQAHAIICDFKNLLQPGVVAMILSPLSLIGAFLLPTLGTASIVPLLLVLTGLSFPMLGVSVGVYFTNSTIVVFGVANLVVPIFLSNRDVANAFKKTAPQQPSQIKPETLSKEGKETKTRTSNHHRQT